MQQAQQPLFAPPQPFQVPMPHSHNPLAPYMPSTAPELDLSNSPRLQNLIRDGKIYLSLHDAIAVAIENNLDLAYFRYNFPIAQTDILRTKSGAQANGVNTAIVQSTQGGFAASTGGGGGSSGPDSPPVMAASSPRPSAPVPPFRPSIPTSPSRATSITPTSRRPTSS
jgi:hypothetical protein